MFFKIKNHHIHNVYGTPQGCAIRRRLYRRRFPHFFILKNIGT